MRQWLWITLLAVGLCGCPYLPDDVAPPAPGPNPPGPVEPVVAGNLRVLIVEETAERHRLMPDQIAMLTAGEVRNYLIAKTAKVGNTPGYRILDKDADLKHEDGYWRELMGKPRQSVPWIVIKNDKTEYAGPLPKSLVEVMGLLKKYGG